MLKYLICCYIARFESVGASPARLPGLPALRLFMLGWMHPSPDKCMARPCTRAKNLLSYPGLPPLGPSRLFRVQLSAVVTAEDHHWSTATCRSSAGSKPLGNKAAPSV